MNSPSVGSAASTLCFLNAFALEHELSADAPQGSVVVSSGALNSALLLSPYDKHRNGPANDSGVVTRCYTRHSNSAFIALLYGENPTKLLA